MSRRELDTAIGWAAAEGWNPGVHDGDCFYHADSNGFLMGLLDDEPIGSISAVRYGSSFGFIGYYIVRPEFRGKGYGLRLWNVAMRNLEGRSIGLDAVALAERFNMSVVFETARMYANSRPELPLERTFGVTSFELG